MSLRSLWALPLLLAGLGVMCAEESPGPGAAAVPVSVPGSVPGSVPVAVPVRRRYSEAALASDYSRSVERALGRSFVRWLLERRERDSANPSLKQQLFSYAILGFALSEAMGLFCLMVAFLILFAM
ncbi:ATP synthase F(0) complex subunit C2, mitochondrial [Lonchura striata]|uniref:ATP synthase lipid-binding protein n=1 Tax=Lonchura striata TaxID=40157 RepID=A0A218UAT5_9PASE|nr:ATP synthase F(0) complex subunit C2, mitochondrial [Lonchura striata domestica]